jgi:hypothetical protein
MKERIDRYFTESYSELIDLATKHISYHNRGYDPVDVVSHVYEYCVSKEVEDVAGTCYRMIMTSCYWNNSALNRELLLKQTPFEGTEDFDAKPIEVDDCETLEKIRLEKWFNDRKALLALYRERIKVDKPKQIVLDKMIEFKTTNSRRLGKHFGIHYLSAYAYIREIQEEIRDFEEELNNYDLKNNLSR